MRVQWGAAAASLLLALAGCGDDTDQAASPSPTATVTVTETVTATPETSEAESPTPLEGDGATVPALMPGQSAVLGPDDEGDSVEVVLNKVSYPKPKAGDRVSKDRVLVALEMTITHLTGEDVYGTNVYPNFQTVDGQLIEDTGWVIGAYGNYGTEPNFSEELPDSVGVGQHLQGWSLYEIPNEPGSLIFPYGPAEFHVFVEPPG